MIKSIEELTLPDVVNIIRKRSWIIIAFTILSIFFIAFYTSTAPDIYQAETTILLEKQQPKISTVIRDIMPRGGRVDKEYYETQLKLLVSYSLADRVFAELDLEKDPAFADSPKPVNKLLSMVSLKPVKKTHMAIITVTGRSPEKITSIANIWVISFIKKYNEEQMGKSQYDATWLEGQLHETSDKLKGSEKLLVNFTKENRDIIDREIKVEQLKTQKEEVAKELFQAARKYNDQHPTMIALNTQLKEINDGLERETNEYLANHDMLVEYKILLRNVESYKTLYDSLLQRSKELDIAKRLSISNIQIVDPARLPTDPADPLPLKMKLLVIIIFAMMGAALSYYLESIDPTLKTSDEVEFYVKLPFLGYVPSAGSGGGKPLIAPLFSIPFIVNFYQKLRTNFSEFSSDDDASSSKDSIPLTDRLKGHIQSFFARLLFFQPETDIDDKREKCLFSYNNPNSIVAESFRNIKVSLAFSAAEKGPLKTITLTSSVPQEGKTFIACNLATVFAQKGEPTLLIDADMRKGHLREVFKIKEKIGLSDILTETASAQQAIMPTSNPHLFVLPSGKYVTNTSDLLNTDAFSSFFTEICSKYGKIIVDIPPVLSLPDCLFWGKLCDALLFIIKAGVTPLETIREAKKMLSDQISASGSLLNLAEIKQKDIRYYFHYYHAAPKA